MEKTEIALTQRGLALGSLNDMFRFAQYVVASNLAPAGLKTPEQVVVALQTGSELGLPPMASLRSLAVINGKTTLYGDAGLAMIRKSGELEAFEESMEGEIGLDLSKTPNKVHAKCTATRDGTTVTGTFSVEDAKRAKLWLKKSKQGYDTPWCTHPQRMLKFKARAFVLRDLFGDVLEGLSFYEEYVGTEPTPEVEIKRDMGSKVIKSVEVVETNVIEDRPKPQVLPTEVIDETSAKPITASDKKPSWL